MAGVFLFSILQNYLVQRFIPSYYFPLEITLSSILLLHLPCIRLENTVLSVIYWPWFFNTSFHLNISFELNFYLQNVGPTRPCLLSRNLYCFFYTIFLITIRFSFVAIKWLSCVTKLTNCYCLNEHVIWQKTSCEHVFIWCGPR